MDYEAYKKAKSDINISYNDYIHAMNKSGNYDYEYPIDQAIIRHVSKNMGSARMVMLLMGYVDDVSGDIVDVGDSIDNIDTNPADNMANIVDLIQLTRTQQITIEKLDNIISDHLRESDFSGALSELQGKLIPNSSGGFWDHIQEMKDSYTGLKHVQYSLEGSLNNPNLTLDTREILQSNLNKTNEYIEKIENLFEPYGGIK